MIFNLVAILGLHFVADFLLQTRKMGLNKGKSVMWLSIHVGVYLIAFLIFGLLFGHLVLEDPTNMKPVLEYCILNASLHWVTDFLTSRLGGWCWNKSLDYKQKGNTKKEMLWQYNFFGVLGLDQFIHGACLLLTYHYFFV